MKNILKIFAVVLVAAFLMVSCKEKGGTIVVKNTWANEALVVIVKGSLTKVPEINKDNSTVIAPGKEKSFEKDEDGVYAVCATSLEGQSFGPTPATLLAGNSVTVTIK